MLISAVQKSDSVIHVYIYCVYSVIHVYISVYICVYSVIHVYICVYIYVYIQLYMCIYVCIYIYTCRYTCVYIYVYILLKYSFPLWFITGYQIHFPVLHSRTWFYILSLHRIISIHQPLILETLCLCTFLPNILTIIWNIPGLYHRMALNIWFLNAHANPLELAYITPGVIWPGQK